MRQKKRTTEQFIRDLNEYTRLCDREEIFESIWRVFFIFTAGMLIAVLKTLPGVINPFLGVAIILGCFAFDAILFYKFELGIKAKAL